MPTEYDFNLNNGETFEIRVKHATERVQRQKQITRTINYVDEKGRKLADSVTQISRMLTQYGSRDKVTGDITWGKWNFVDSNSSTSYLPFFDSYDIPQQSDHYSVVNGKAVKTIPRSGITVDENGNPVSTTIDVFYQSNVVEISEAQPVTRDIYINGLKIYTQYLVLNRTGQKNILTGEITWNEWSYGTFPAFQVPKISGYESRDPFGAVSRTIGGGTVLAQTKYRSDLTYGETTSDNTELVSQTKSEKRDIYMQVEGQDTRKKVTTQEVTVYRIGVKNLTTGETTWNDWQDCNIPAYPSPTVDGYTVTNSDAGAAMTVDGSETQLQDVVFEYQANTATNQSSNSSMTLVQENDEDVDPNKKSITRTIIIHNLDGTTQKIVQTINFEKSSDSDSFIAVDSPEIDGYTTNTKQVPGEKDLVTWTGHIV